MKRTSTLVLLAFIMIFSFTIYGQDTNLSISIDGKLLEPDKFGNVLQAQVKGEEIMIPTPALRNMGHNIFSDETSGTLVIDDGEFVLPIGTATKNPSQSEVNFNKHGIVRGVKTELKYYIYLEPGSSFFPYRPDYSYVSLNDLKDIFGHQYQVTKTGVNITLNKDVIRTRGEHENYLPKYSDITKQTRHTKARKPGTTIEEDEIYLHSIYPLYAGSTKDNFSLSEGDESKGERIISIYDWQSRPVYTVEAPLQDTFHSQRRLIEALKYFSAYYTDGIRIYGYIDQVINRDMPVMSQTLTFGKTSVKVHAYYTDKGKYIVELSFIDNENYTASTQKDGLFKTDIKVGNTYKAKDILNETVFGSPNSFILCEGYIYPNFLDPNTLSVYIHPQRTTAIELSKGAPLIKEFGFLHYPDRSAKQNELAARVYKEQESGIILWFLDESGVVIDALTSGMWAGPYHMENMINRTSGFDIIDKCSYIVFSRFKTNAISIMENPYKGNGLALPGTVVAY